MNILNKWKFSILLFVYFFVIYNTNFVVDEFWKLIVALIPTIIIIGAASYEIAKNLVKKGY